MKRISNHTVKGDDFQVNVPDIHTVIYSESDRQATIEIEGGEVNGEIDWLVYSRTLDGWTGATNQPMTNSERELVLNRISKSLTLLEMKHSME